MRIASPLFLSVALGAATLCLAACGGGGGGGGGGPAPQVGSAALGGRVVLRDGTTSQLGGLQITCLSTGDTVTTAPNGSFEFGLVPAGTIALRVFDPTALVVAQANGDDDPAGDDHGDDRDDDANDDGDDHDVGDDDFDITGVADGSEIRVEIEVRGGRVDGVRHSCSDEDEREGRARLTRADTSDDPDVSGKAELESRVDRQRLEIEAEHLDVGRSVRAIVILEGVEADLGVRDADLEGEAEWELSTNDGDVLPHGATTVDELVGASVEVRDAATGTVLLRGTFPDLPTSVDGDDDDDDGDHDGHESTGRLYLVNALGVVGKASVEVQVRDGDGGLRQKLQVEVEHQVPGTLLELWLETALGSAALEQVGTWSVGGDGEGELEFDTHDGDTLPFGVTDVTALSGRAVEIRDGTGGAVLYSGTVPTAVGED